MGFHHHCTRRCFITAAGFHAHIAVFNYIQSAHAIGAGHFIEVLNYCGRRHLDTVDSDNIALFVTDIEVGSFIRGFFRRYGPAPHFIFSFRPGIFQVAALVGDMQQVGVHGERRFLAALHLYRNTVLFTVVHQLVTGVEVPLTPGGNYLDTRLKGIGPQLEAHLVITLTGGTVGDGISTGFVGNLDQALGNQWTRDGGTEQVLTFVDGIGAEHGEDKVPCVLFSQVINVDLFYTQGFSFGTGGFNLFTLADIGGESHYFAVVLFLQPLDDN